MSQSQLFKNMMAKKMKEEYYFLIYKRETKKGVTDVTPLQIFNDYDKALKDVLSYNIDELCGKYIITSKLLYTLLSKKSVKTKVDSIKYEYTKLFRDNYNFSYNITPIKKDSRALKIIQNRIEKQEKRKMHGMIEYIKFYEHCKINLGIDSNECGDLISFL